MHIRYKTVLGLAGYTVCVSVRLGDAADEECTYSVDRRLAGRGPGGCSASFIALRSVARCSSGLPSSDTAYVYLTATSST
jgi:hypothetical protein